VDLIRVDLAFCQIANKNRKPPPPLRWQYCDFRPWRGDPRIRWKNQKVKIQDADMKTVKGLSGMFAAKRGHQQEMAILLCTPSPLTSLKLLQLRVR
jgi:hypothetical protein